jgi:hypothetical protein
MAYREDWGEPMKSRRRILEVYIEGGGTAEQRRLLRQAFRAALEPVIRQAESAQWTVHPIFCGSRSETIETFVTDRPPKNANHRLLLVDSEGPVSKEPHAHIAQERSQSLGAFDPQDFHLMAQCMETWILAGDVAFNEVFGPDFDAKKLPKRSNLEEESPQACEENLKLACAKTKSKTYDKGRHSAALLQRIQWPLVCERLHHARRFNNRLVEVVASPPAAE